MKVTDIRYGFGHRLVTVEGFTADRPVSDDFVMGFACRAAGETPQSLMGISISRQDDIAVVKLVTD